MTPREYVALKREWEREQEALDRRAALPAWALFELNRDPKKRSQPFTIEEFMPRKRRKPQTPAQMAALIEANNALLGGVDTRKKVIGATEEQKQAFLARLKAQREVR